MKKLLFILTLCLSMLFSPFVFAAGLIDKAPEYPGFEAPVFVGNSPEIISFGYAGNQKTADTFIICNSTKTNFDPAAIILTTGSKLITQHNWNLNYWEAAHRTGIGLELSPMTANNKQKRDLAALAG